MLSRDQWDIEQDQQGDTTPAGVLQAEITRLREENERLNMQISQAEFAVLDARQQAQEWEEFAKSAESRLDGCKRSADHHRERAETLEARLAQAREAIKIVEIHCPCGARPESPSTHSHVGGCPVYAALRALDG